MTRIVQRTIFALDDMTRNGNIASIEGGEQWVECKTMQNVSLHDLILDIHELDRKLQVLEAKYGLLSADFFQLYEAGQLRDEEVEEIDEFGQWAALYRMRARRVAQYEKMKDVYIVAQSQANGIVLKPYAATPEPV
jgi:hypothetical protein